MDLVALGTAHSSLVLQLGPTRVFGWAWDRAGMGVSETSSQKPQLLVTIGVHGPAARCAAESSSVPPAVQQCPRCCYLQREEIFSPPAMSVSSLSWWAALAGAALDIQVFK